MSLSPDNKKYNPSIDLLRILATISVIIIHVTTKILEISGNNLLGFPFAMFFNQAFRFAVPLFFFISAFVLELNYPQKFNYFNYLKKRFTRLFIPYLLWSIVYYFVIYPNHQQSFFFALFLGDSSYQLYFIPTLFIFYLFFPLLHRYVKFFSSRFIIILFTLLQIIFLSIDYYFRPLSLPYPLAVFFLNFAIFVYGAIASQNQILIKKITQKYKYVFLTLSLLFSFLIFWQGTSTYLQTGNYLSYYSQWRPSIFFYTIIVTSLLFYIFSRLDFNPNFIKKIASYSFFVYFVHVIFIEASFKYLPPSLLSYFIFPLAATTILSYLSAYIVSKLPRISKFLG